MGEVTVRGFQTSGSGPVSAAIRQAAGGYDPKWIAGFNKFVEGGLKAIELTLTFATLAHDLNNLGGSGIRAGVNLIDDAAKGGSKVPNFIVSKGGTVFPPVPRGATGPIPASSGKGFQFIKGVGDKGLSPKAMGFRFMDPITTGKYQYPGGVMVLILIKQDKLLIPLQVRQYHLQTHGGIYLLNNINYGKTKLKKTYIEVIREA